jgi:hypothetical protein
MGGVESALPAWVRTSNANSMAPPNRLPARAISLCDKEKHRSYTPLPDILTSQHAG